MNSFYVIAFLENRGGGVISQNMYILPSAVSIDDSKRGMTVCGCAVLWGLHTTLDLPPSLDYCGGAKHPRSPFFRMHA